MKGICCVHPFQRATVWCEVVWKNQRLTPEYNQNEWALIDVNKSGTAEAYEPSSLDITRDEVFFVSRYTGSCADKSGKRCEKGRK